jgi:O-antigen/teichoic acid export membrane protein
MTIPFLRSTQVVDQLEQENGSHRRLILSTAVANWVAFVSNVLLTLIVSPILVHGLGDRRYGAWALIDSILAYLTLLDLGVASSVVRYVARFKAVGDNESLGRVINTSLAIFVSAGGVAVAIAAVLLGPVWPLLRVPQDIGRETWWLLAMLSFNLAAGLPLGVFASALDGLQRYATKATVRVGTLVLQSVLSVLTVRSGGGLIPLAILITACQLSGQLILLAICLRSLPGIRLSPLQADRATFRVIRGYSLYAFLAMLAGRVSFQTDAIVIGAMMAPEQITYFVLGARLVEYAKSMVRSMTTVLTPMISHWEATGRVESIQRTLFDGTRMVVWMVLPVQIGFWLLGRPFLTLWMGPVYAERSYPVLGVLSISLTLLLSQSISGRILYGVGRLRFFTFLVLAEALANLLLSVALAQPLGILGVAWGTAIPSLIANIVVAVYVCKLLEVSALEYLKQSFLRPLSVAPLLCFLWLAATWVFRTPDWFTLVVTGSAGLLAYLLSASLVEWGLSAVSEALDRMIGGARRRFSGSDTQTEDGDDSAAEGSKIAYETTSSQTCRSH